MLHFIECDPPRNFLQEMLIVDAVNSAWEARRYSRNKTLVIECEHERHQEMEKKRLRHARKVKAERAWWKAHDAEKAAQPKDADQTGEAGEAEQVGTPTTQLERKLELEEVIDSTVAEVDEILLAPADEVDHAKAMQSGIDYYERLHRLFRDAIGMRNDALRHLELYRQSLSQQLHRHSNEIVDAEFSETGHEPPLLLALMETPNDDR